MFKKNLYKWHRTCSLIIAIPVILWASSGFMHPIMTNIRPVITTQELPLAIIDSSKIKISLKTALAINHIDSVNTVRLVHIDTTWFYQVQNAFDKQQVYLNVTNGKILKKGDWLYAVYLARIFLEGVPGKDKMQYATKASSPVADCCSGVSACVLNPVHGVPIKEVSVIDTFDMVYQSINRVVPVYKVSFDRPDGIAVYVETAHSKFCFAADKKRVVFSTLFSLIHTWEWINFLGKGRLFVIIFFSGLTFLTALMGIYIFFSTKSKKVAGNALVKARRNHRYTSIVVSLFTLMFSFSGCYLALSQLKPDDTNQYVIKNTYPSSQINLDFVKLQSVVKKPMLNIGLITLDNKAYWQVYTGTTDDKGVGAKDLMKEMKVTASEVMYISASDYTILSEGEKKYASYLATKFSHFPMADIVSTKQITNFNADYDFADKLLPVWKVSYNKDHHQRYYIETSSGKLSKRTNDIDAYPSYSFAFLHKHEFLSSFGKGVKDFSTMFWAMAQIVMVSIGLTFYFKLRRSNKQKKEEKLS